MLLATTKVDVERPSSDDPYEAGTIAVVYAAEPAHIGDPSGDDVAVGGDKELVTAVLLIGPRVDLQRIDIIHDRGTGERYAIAWTRRRRGLGLDHVKAGLRAVKGGAG